MQKDFWTHRITNVNIFTIDSMVSQKKTFGTTQILILKPIRMNSVKGPHYWNLDFTVSLWNQIHEKTMAETGYLGHDNNLHESLIES